MTMAQPNNSTLSTSQTPRSQPNKPACNVCKKPARYLCSMCSRQYYCSRECQKRDWKSHKAYCLLGGYVWEFQEDDGDWLEFAKLQQVELEGAYCRKDCELRFAPRDDQKRHRWGRVVSFAEMTQRNEETGKVRNVRRRALPLFPLPILAPTASLESHPLATSGPEFNTIVRIFKMSMTSHRKSFDSDEWCPKPMVEVIKVEEVVNPLKQRLYEVAQDEVGSRNPSGCGPVPGISAQKHDHSVVHVDLNEYFLFHGTNYDNVDKIIEHGLDPQRGGDATGTLFGIGAYFAENASKSDLYTTCDQCAARPSADGKCHHPTGM